ncbi:hypothetical protein BH24ACT8_BH24ACT8_10870 [soil metagenome]
MSVRQAGWAVSSVSSASSVPCLSSTGERRSCRAPGCLVPARRCELDHEQPHGLGGATTEVNLNDKHPPHHQLKTERLWSTTMDATRVVTWATFFGRIHRTRGLDHRQYHPGPDHESSAGRTRADQPGIRTGPGDALSVTDPDLRDQLVYAALSARGGQDRWLEAIDDNPETWTPRTGRPLALFHQRHGRRRPGPPPDQPTPQTLLRPPAPPGPPTSAGSTDQDEPPPF